MNLIKCICPFIYLLSIKYRCVDNFCHTYFVYSQLNLQIYQTALSDEKVESGSI